MNTVRERRRGEEGREKGEEKGVRTRERVVVGRRGGRGEKGEKGREEGRRWERGEDVGEGRGEMCGFEGEEGTREKVEKVSQQPHNLGRSSCLVLTPCRGQQWHL